MVHPMLILDVPNARRVYQQIAITLLRPSMLVIDIDIYTCILKYLGVSYGSCRNSRTRTYKTIKGILRHHISWSTDPERAANIALRFEFPHTRHDNDNKGQRSLDVIRFFDGKNIVIHKPSLATYGSMFRDRKNTYSVKLTAVCKSNHRFNYIRVGDSDNYFKKRHVKLLITSKISQLLLQYSIVLGFFFLLSYIISFGNKTSQKILFFKK